MLNRTTYLIKEQVAFLKLTDRYDIYAPENGQPIKWQARQHLCTKRSYMDFFADSVVR